MLHVQVSITAVSDCVAYIYFKQLLHSLCCSWQHIMKDGLNNKGVRNTGSNLQHVQVENLLTYRCERRILWLLKLFNPVSCWVWNSHVCNSRTYVSGIEGALFLLSLNLVRILDLFSIVLGEWDWERKIGNECLWPTYGSTQMGRLEASRLVRSKHNRGVDASPSLNVTTNILLSDEDRSLLQIHTIRNSEGKTACDTSTWANKCVHSRLINSWPPSEIFCIECSGYVLGNRREVRGL